MKAGWKTTEFWTVVVSSVLAVAVAAGYLTGDQATEISSGVVDVINAVTKLIGVLAPVVGVVTYVWSRTRVKTSV